MTDQIQKLFVPYEIALKAKEKGFNEHCLGYFNSENILKPVDTDFINFRQVNKELVKCPLYQQLINWLFHEHRIWITVENYYHVEPTDKLPFGFCFYIEQDGHCEVGKTKNGYFKTQYEALDKALIEALNLIP